MGPPGFAITGWRGFACMPTLHGFCAHAPRPAVNRIFLRVFSAFSADVSVVYTLEAVSQTVLSVEIPGRSRGRPRSTGGPGHCPPGEEKGVSQVTHCNYWAMLRLVARWAEASRL